MNIFTKSELSFLKLIDNHNLFITESSNKDRERVLNKTVSILEELGYTPKISKKSKDKWIATNNSGDIGGESLCISIGQLKGLEKVCSTVNKEIKPEAKLSPDNYGTVFLSMKESVVTESYLGNYIRNKIYLHKMGNSPELNRKSIISFIKKMETHYESSLLDEEVQTIMKKRNSGDFYLPKSTMEFQNGQEITFAFCYDKSSFTPGAAMKTEDGKYVILLYPKFFESTDMEEKILTVMHEIGHVRLGHVDQKNQSIDTNRRHSQMIKGKAIYPELNADLYAVLNGAKMYTILSDTENMDYNRKYDYRYSNNELALRYGFVFKKVKKYKGLYESVTSENGEFNVEEIYFKKYNDRDYAYVKLEDDERPLRGRSEIIIMKDDEVFLCFKDDGKYRLPGGGWDKLESYEHAAVREAKEESRILCTDVEYSTCRVDWEDKVPEKCFKENIPEDGYWYGWFTKIYIAKYNGKFTDHIDKEDQDKNMIENGKFYPYDEVKDKLYPEHRRSIENYLNDKIKVMEAVDNDSKTVQELIDLHNYLNDFDYTIPENDIKKYRYPTPSEFVSNRGGICWDFVMYQSYILSKKKIPFKNYFIVLGTPNYDCHTFTVVKVDNLYYYIESSFVKIKGIYTSKNLKDIFDFVINNMMELVNVSEVEYEIHEYTSYTKYGCSSYQFMDYMCDKAPKIKGGKAKHKNELNTISKYMESDDMDVDEFYDDVMLEASTDTHIILEEIYPNVEKVLSTREGDKLFKRYVEEFVDRNTEKLHEPCPISMIAFTDHDKAKFYSLFEFDEKTLIKIVTKAVNAVSNQAQFKLVKQNPIFSLFYCVLRYYTLKNDTAGINSTLIIHALASYPSVFSKYFKYGANAGVMRYTADHLTEKFIFKQEKHVFGALRKSIDSAYKFLKPYFEEATDKEIIRYIQRIRNDQNSMIKKIAIEYNKNYNAGKSVSTQSETYDTGALIDEYNNDTSKVETISQKVIINMLTNGIDLRILETAGAMAQLSVTELRLYLTKIVIDSRSTELEEFVNAVLFIYLFDEKHEISEIKSRAFLSFGVELFRKTNSNNKNIVTIKSTLDKWAEETGIHSKYRREPTRISYKKGIYWYILLTIQTNM